MPPAMLVDRRCHVAYYLAEELGGTAHEARFACYSSVANHGVLLRVHLSAHSLRGTPRKTRYNFVYGFGSARCVWNRDLMQQAMSPSRRFATGERFGGKYRLRRRLAAGGMGDVWLARNVSTGAEVALKLLARADSELEPEMEVEQRFRNEACMTAGLSHRNIVKVFDLLEEPDGTLGLVMERLRGETLFAYVRRLGARPSRDAVEIMIPILNALEHAHVCGVVHRDVSPSNIFLAVDPDGHVTPKLVDFGIAKSRSSPTGEAAQPIQTLDGRVLGTPMYLAPERIRGSDDSDPRSDVFSAAVVVYETITGTSPFAASTPSASLAAVLERPVDPDPRIDPRLWLEIRRAMAKQPYERHAAAREFADALRASLGEVHGALEAGTMKDPPIGWEADDVDESEASGSAHPFKPQRGTRLSAVWISAAVVIAAVLGVVIIGARSLAGRARAAPADPPAAPSAENRATTPLVATSAPTTRVAAAAPTTPALPEAPSSTTAGIHLSASPPKSSVRPRPIATTPGF
jgi:eukaryotic-like serine/threonine-protein kinase